MYGEKAWRKLHKNAASNIEQVLKAAPDKAATLRHHENYPNCTVTYLSSRKLFKLDEPDTRGTAEEVGTSSWVMYSCGPLLMAE